MADPKPNPKPAVIVPNKERVLVRLQSGNTLVPKNELLMPGQLKAGENLLFGEVVAVPKPWVSDSGEKRESAFKVGQFVYYSEYSAAALYPLGKVKTGELSLGEALKEDNKVYVVSEDDIMAAEE